MSVKNSIKAITAQVVAFGSVTNAFVAITPAGGLPQPCFKVRIINGTNEGIDVSYDGTTQNDYIPAGSTLEIPTSTNTQPQNYTTLAQRGLPIYIRYSAVGIAPTSGNVALAGYYQPFYPTV